MTTAASPRLLVTDQLGRRSVLLDRPLVTLGRRSESDVFVQHAGVSRLHAEIRVENGACRIRDCGSKFGTFVNGARATEQVLAHGDRIVLGEAQDTEIVFFLFDAPTTPDHSGVAAASELRHMASLLEGLRAMGSSRVLDDVLALVLDAALDVTGAERGFIMLADAGGELEFKLARARGRITLSGRSFQTSRKIPETVFQTGRAAFVDDLADGALAGQHMGTVAIGIRHVLCTPLLLVRLVEKKVETGEQPIIGVLYLDSREKGALSTASTRSALDMLSSEAAVAIENARLYREALENAKLEQDLKVAAAIQQSLLPPAGREGGFFTFAGASAACRSIGGDFFDYVDLPDGEFAFILGDVAGKGSPAALLSAAMLGMFIAESGYQTGAAPLLARLNRGLLRRQIAGRFVTTFFGLLSSTGALTYANGGHNPPVLVAKAGVRRLETGGLVLGLFDHATFEEETVQLDPGDMIVVFSDGVSEAENDTGDMFGDERLLASLAARRGQSPRDLLDGLLADVRTFCGATLPNDDVTALVVQYNGGEAL